MVEHREGCGAPSRDVDPRLQKLLDRVVGFHLNTADLPTDGEVLQAPIEIVYGGYSDATSDQSELQIVRPTIIVGLHILMER